MAIKVQCPKCHQGFTAPPTLAGKRVGCPKCKEPISIPAENLADPPAVSAAAKPGPNKGGPPPKQQPQQAAPQITPPQRPAPPPLESFITAEAATDPVRSGSMPEAMPGHRGKGRVLAALAIASLILAGAGGGAYYYFVIRPNSANATLGRNNLKNIALGMESYCANQGRFPPRIGRRAQPTLSWRVMILPYIGQGYLQSRFNLDEPWDSEQNKALIQYMPEVYQSPTRPKDKKTTYLVPVGKGTIYENPQGFDVRGVADGMSNTILLVEAAEDRAVIWTQPDDLEYNADKPLEGLGQNGFSGVFGDGAVRFIKSSISPDTLRALFSRAGGEKVNSNQLD